MINIEKKTIVNEINELLDDKNSLKASVLIVSEKYDRTFESTRKLYYRYNDAPEKEHKNCILTIIEEVQLRILLLGMCQNYMAVSLDLIASIVLSCFGKVVSSKWVRRYVKKRDDELKVVNSKYFPKKRNVPKITNEIEAFIAALGQQIEKVNFSENNVFNYDETKITVKSEGNLKVMSRAKSNNNNCFIKRDSLASLLSFISPNGKSFVSFYILKSGNSDRAKTDKLMPYYPKEKRYLRSKLRRFFCFSKSGNLTAVLFNGIMKIFAELWQSEHPGLQCYVFGDQLGAHKDLETVKMCIEKNVFLWSLPANTSHFLQPLDNLCFANLKKKFKKKIEQINLKAYLTKLNVREDLFAAMYEAENESMCPSIINESFRNTGIFPFDPEKIRALTQENNGKLKVSSNEMINDIACHLDSIIDDVSSQINSDSVMSEGDDYQFVNSPQSLVDLRKKKEAEAKQRVITQNDKKRKREQEEMDRIERRIRNKCIVSGCTIVKQERSKWIRCGKCNRFICPGHKKQKDLHEFTCTHDYME